MEKKEQNKTEQEKHQLITVTMFHQSIIDGLNPNELNESKKTRYFKEKTEILEHLLYYACSKEEDRAKEKTESKLPLLAFSFFLSSNSDFPYNWNYLISKNQHYYNYLDRFKEYIDFVTTDLSEIMDKMEEDIYVTFRIDGIFTINVHKHNNSAELECTTDLDSIHRIIGISRDSYDLAMFRGDVFIGEYRRKKMASEKSTMNEGQE